MRQITSQFLRNNFGEVWRLASREPIAVTKAQRVRAVLISSREYEDLVILRGLRWLVTENARLGDVPAEQEGSWKELMGRLKVLAECRQQPVSRMIRIAIEEKIAKWEEALTAQLALQESHKRWTLSELMTGKDLMRHGLRG